MAVVVPLISMYAGAAAGYAVATGAAAMTLGSALAIAGGMMSAVGMIEKDNDAKKLGGILSLFSGVAGAFDGAAAAGPAPTGTGDVAQSLTSSAEPIAGASEIGQQAALGSAGSSVGATAEPFGVGDLTGIDASGNVVSPMGGGMGNPASSTQVAQSLTGDIAAPQTALEKAAATMTHGDIASANQYVQGLGIGAPNGQMLGTQAPQSLWDQVAGKAGGYFDAAGKWVKANPMAAQAGFRMLEGMYGPKAEELDYQKSLMERARANLNQPVRLRYSPTPGG